MKIGIIADTHDLLRPGVEENLRGCGCILHAGDLSSRKILDRLSEIAPVRAVRGNNDGEWAEDLPLILETELDGLKICMAHKKKDLPADLGPFDLAVCGHSHQYASVWHEAGGRRILLLNPGSCGPRRFHQPITLAVRRRRQPAARTCAGRSKQSSGKRRRGGLPRRSRADTAWIRIRQSGLPGCT